MWPLDFARAAAVDAAKVQCPVYIVSCGKDRLTPASVVRKAAKRYPHATQRHYAERGHWVIDDEETEEMMHAICGWLRPFEQRIERAAQVS
jgi:pimeloyl-ACP methyl ester carboxylesterase